MCAPPLRFCAVCNWLRQSFIGDSAQSLTILAPRCQPQLHVASSPSGRSSLWQTQTETRRGPAAPNRNGTTFQKTCWRSAEVADKITPTWHRYDMFVILSPCSFLMMLLNVVEMIYIISCCITPCTASTCIAFRGLMLPNTHGCTATPLFKY